ncbi:MAG TPA: endonuclease domain-containing protein [bacterium]|nr:endonuclease domain-containing protein [bacterium]
MRADRRLPRIADYDVRLKARARELRRNQTEAEKKLWVELLRDRVFGYKFTRQKPLLHFIADFYCSELLLVIELDGSSHDEKAEYDEERTILLNQLGIQVIRYTNSDVLQNIEGVYADLKTRIEVRAQELRPPVKGD